jgi:hypothetical protein
VAQGGAININAAPNRPNMTLDASSIFINGGTVSIGAGAGMDESVTLAATNDLTIFSTNGLTVTGGAGTNAFVSLSAGTDLTLNSAGAIDISGGTGTGAFARAQGNAVETTSNGFHLEGGGAGAFARITGSTVDIASNGDITLQGGNGAGAFAAVSATGTVTLSTLASGTIFMTAGTGSNADAVVVAPTQVNLNSGSCTGCIVLTTDPFADPTIQTGVQTNALVLNGVPFGQAVAGGAGGVGAAALVADDIIRDILANTVDNLEVFSPNEAGNTDNNSTSGPGRTRAREAENNTGC